MAEKYKRVHFIVGVDGGQYNLFSVREVPNSEDREQLDLNIHFSSNGRSFFGKTLDELLNNWDKENYTATDTHISVHANPRSPSTNTIKRTIKKKDDDSEPKTNVLLTQGIKKDNLFVPFLFRVCGDLQTERFEIDDNEDDKLIKICDYNPNTDQLRFMLIVSKRDKKFPKEDEHPSNIAYYEFRDYVLTIIYSFFNLPSHPQFINFLLYSMKEHGVQKGLDWWQAYNLYTELNMIHINNYIASFGEDGKRLW